MCRLPHFVIQRVPLVAFPIDPERGQRKTVREELRLLRTLKKVENGDIQADDYC